MIRSSKLTERNKFMVKKSAVIISIIFLYACLAVTVSFAADGQSYEQLSPNGKYLFVMLSKTPDKPERIDTLKDKYGRSGLYRAGKTGKPIWTVNWYSPTVHVSSDGIHLVRIGRPVVEAVSGKPDMAQLAIAFYEKGKQIRKYAIRDLISRPSRLAKSGKGFKWQERIAFDDETGKIVITLVTGQKKAFSIKTGKLVADKK